MDPGVKAKPRWCWNWQTGMVEGHMPLGRAGSIPAQRTSKNRRKAVFSVYKVLLKVLLGFIYSFFEKLAHELKTLKNVIKDSLINVREFPQCSECYYILSPAY